MARAKRTARAEARRRYRAEQGDTTDILDAEDPAGPTARPTPTTATARAAAGQPQRLGLGEAFRRSFRPVDLPGDLRAFPRIATRSKALWVPLLLTIASTIAFSFTMGADFVTRFMFAYFVQTPAIGGVFIAGFLAPRAAWLLGAIVGFVSAICYTALLLTVFSADLSKAGATGSVGDIVGAAFVLSPVMGAVFAAAAAWYRRFLTLSNPNRGSRPSQGPPRPDGRSRGRAQKASR